MLDIKMIENVQVLFPDFDSRVHPIIKELVCYYFIDIANDQQHRPQPSLSESADAPPIFRDLEDANGNVLQWSVLHFNNGSATPLVL